MDEKNRQPGGWKRDYFAACEVWSVWWIPLTLLTMVGMVWVMLKVVSFKHGATTEVIVYTSQDQVYAEPLLQEFERRSGIRVRAVYDSEAVKTVGLVNRLIAEKNHPQCDVFWNNEELRTRQLDQMGILRETNAWAAFGFRERLMVVNTKRFNGDVPPPRFLELTNQMWRGRVALAYPLFGTTGTHFLVLRQRWGEKAWRDWCRALQANKPLLVDGNSVVVKMVGRGEAWIGLTDSDDVLAGAQDGLSVASVPIDLAQEGLQIPNTVAILRGALHPAEAQQLSDYLSSDGVYQYLFNAGALQGRATVVDGGSSINWNALLATQQAGLDQLKEVFLR